MSRAGSGRTESLSVAGKKGRRAEKNGTAFIFVPDDNKIRH